MPYKVGKPTKGKPNYLAGLIIVIIVAGLLGAAYYFLVRAPNGSATIRNDNTPLVSKIGDRSTPLSYSVKEPYFTMSLPGSWKETARDSDAHYHSIQWNYTAPKAANRWIRVYIDTIPSDFAINYLLPVMASAGQLEIGQMSDNCTSFTQANDGQNAAAGLPARWQGISFLCDNINPTYQVVGTGSTGSINSVAVSGSTGGEHNYFFVYRDDSFHPDLSVLADVLSSFKAR